MKNIPKRTPVPENDIPDVVARFKALAAEADRPRTAQSFLVPKAEIAQNGYDLSINKYKQTEYKPVDYPPTADILAELNTLAQRRPLQPRRARRVSGRQRRRL